MSIPYQTIETLSLVANPEQAEQVAGCLRTAGIPTHQYWVEDSYSFAENLKLRSWDLVILAVDDKAGHIPSCILRYPEVPFLAVTQKNKSSLVDHLLDLGVTDVASFSRPARLKHTLNRALADARLRREHRLLRARSDEQATAMKILLQASNDPIAFLHQGLHCFVNPAYLALAGLGDPSTANGTPLLDLVTNKHRKKLKRAIKEFEESRLFHSRLPVEFQRPDGLVQKVVLDMSSTSFEGEAVIQLIVQQPPTQQSQADSQVATLPRHQIRHKSSMAARPQPASEVVPELVVASFDDEDLTLETTLDLAAPQYQCGDGVQAADNEWTECISAILNHSELQIAARPINSLRGESHDRLQLSLNLVPKPEGIRSIEMLLAEARRHKLLAGLDRWLLYNCASELAKQLKLDPHVRFYVTLNAGNQELEALAPWLGELLKKFDLSAGSLNLMLDGGGLTDNSLLPPSTINALKNLQVGVGLYGISQDICLSFNPQDDVTGSFHEQTLSFEMLQALPIDFALLESGFSDRLTDSQSRASLQRLLQRCQQASITTMIETSNPRSLSEIWRLGADCFVGAPGSFADQDHCPAMDLTASIEVSSSVA